MKIVFNVIMMVRLPRAMLRKLLKVFTLHAHSNARSVCINIKL
ncbi:hypothetical protein A2U01_0051358, partial [Trifolium medium]|nr:hypothetical protein [Trifolium medium]